MGRWWECDGKKARARQEVGRFCQQTMNVVADDLVLLNFSIIRKYRPCIPTSAYSAHEGRFHVLLRHLPMIVKVT